jgi:hypothetical protein
LAFFGHSHLPTVAQTIKDSKDIYFCIGNHACEVPVKIEKGIRYIINPGAIGQPRNKGFTTYSIFDTDRMEVRIESFSYDIEGAKEAILKAEYANINANLNLAYRLG